MPWKEAQVGHLLDGRCNSILFEIQGVRIQCPKCNLFLSGNKEVFIPKFIDEMGREAYDDLVRLKHMTRKFTVYELEGIEKFYKERNGL